MGNGQFGEYSPTGITIDYLDNVYVTDFINNRVQKFDSDGNFITKWGVVYPEDISIDSSNSVYVVGDFSIKKFDSNGNFITKWGTKSSSDGQFAEPHGISTDSSGNVYVTDSGLHRIQIFAPNFKDLLDNSNEVTKNTTLIDSKNRSTFHNNTETTIDVKNSSANNIDANNFTSNTQPMLGVTDQI